jgi:hypothetical protein
MALIYTIQRTSESITSPVVVNFAVSGTATFEVDYTVTGAITFAFTSNGGEYQ